MGTHNQLINFIIMVSFICQISHTLLEIFFLGRLRPLRPPLLIQSRAELSRVEDKTPSTVELSRFMIFFLDCCVLVECMDICMHLFSSSVACGKGS